MRCGVAAWGAMGFLPRNRNNAGLPDVSNCADFNGKSWFSARKQSPFCGYRDGFLAPNPAPMSTAPPASLGSLLDRPDLVAAAVRLMRQPTALSELSASDAKCIVTYMRLLNCPEGGMDRKR